DTPKRKRPGIAAGPSPFALSSSLLAVVRRSGVELAVFLLADRLQQLELGLEEVDMAFLVDQQFLEQLHRHVVTELVADLARLLVGGAGVIFSGEVRFENFPDVLADAQRADLLQIGMALEE